MKERYYILILVLVTVNLLNACSKGAGTDIPDSNHEFNPNDTISPVIEIYKPLNNQVFVNGDTIKVEGKVTDNGLYQGSIKITNDANGLIVKEQAYEIHGLLLYNFSIAYKTAVTVTSNYTVKVEFEDHGLNIVNKQVKVKINP